jgi:hypothetical protein
MNTFINTVSLYSSSNKFIQYTGFVLNRKCRDGVFDHAGLRVESVR